MKKITQKFGAAWINILLALAIAVPLMLSGCAAVQTGLEHKDLVVETKMSSTIFLDVEHRTEKTVFLDVKSTADKDVGIEAALKAKLAAKGYRIVENAPEAFYILQVNILQVGTANPSALRDSLYAGWGGALAGGVAGAVAGGSGGGGIIDSYNRSTTGAALGGLLGSAGELIAGSLVKNVTYSVLTDIQIMERSNEAVVQKVESNLDQGTGTKVVQTSESKQERKKYQTRILSTANKVNLEFAEAAPALREGLSKSIAGLL